MPASNAILERFHPVMKVFIQTELHADPAAMIDDANAIINRALSSAQYATRCSVHKTFGLSPGSIVFH